MLVTYRYRIYPNKKQQIQLAKTFGCVRFVRLKILNKPLKDFLKSKLNTQSLRERKRTIFHTQQTSQITIFRWTLGN